MGNQVVFWMPIIVVFAVTLIFLARFASYFHIWIRCVLSGAPVSLPRLVMMRFRKIDVKKLCDLYIMSTQAGLSIELSELERAYLAGADVELVVRAMIKASQTGQNLTWDDALQQAMKDQYDRYVEMNYENAP